MVENWTDLKTVLLEIVQNHSDTHKKKLEFEIEEVEKQGFEAYWVKAYNDKHKYPSNPNKVLIPFILGMVEEDPIDGQEELLLSTKFQDVQNYASKYGKVPSYIIKDPDMPDIDIDCIPEARDQIKNYAIQKYGEKHVCSVGTWSTFKFKSAMIDVAVALGVYKDRYEIERITTELPVDVDALKDEGKAACKGMIKTDDGNKECGHLHRELICPVCGSEDTDGPNIAQILNSVQSLKDFYNKEPKPEDKYSNKDIIEYSLGLIGKMRSTSMHAGALIISDQDLFGKIPMAISASKDLKQSMWSEGRNPQLSKWGYVKWDMLGLKTQAYIFNSCKLIKENRGISFGELLEGWEYIKPLERIAGYYEIDGKKHYISLDDERAISLANLQQTDGVFQFDTDLAKCVRHDSEIDTDCGYVKISNLSPKLHQIKYLANDNTIKYTNDYDVVCSGYKETHRIELEDGSVLNLTEDHRVLTHRGYVRVKDLLIDDEIIESKSYMH